MSDDADDVDMPYKESLVLTISLHGAAAYRIDLSYNADRTVIDTRCVPIGQAVTSGLAQVVLDNAEFGSDEYLRRALAADEAIQLVITSTMKQLAAALGSMRDATAKKSDVTTPTQLADDSVN